MALVSHHLATANAKAAVAAAQAGLAKLPDDPGLLGLLGRGQLAAGDSQQALTSFNRLVGLQGRSPAAHLGLAERRRAVTSDRHAREHPFDRRVPRRHPQRGPQRQLALDRRVVR